MTPEFNVKEYNKMCAEFLGWEKRHIVWVDSDEKKSSGRSLRFDSDWNWIMEVVQKIENIESFLKVETREEFRNFQRVLSLPIYTKLEAVVLAIWQFLNWYKQKKP